MTIRLWDIEHYYKLAKVVGAAKGGINFSGRQPLPPTQHYAPLCRLLDGCSGGMLVCAVNGLCAISDERYASAADNVKIWSIESEE